MSLLTWILLFLSALYIIAAVTILHSVLLIKKTHQLNERQGRGYIRILLVILAAWTVFTIVIAFSVAGYLHDQEVLKWTAS